MKTSNLPIIFSLFLHSIHGSSIGYFTESPCERTPVNLGSITAGAVAYADRDDTLSRAESLLDQSELASRFGDPSFYPYPLRLISIPTLAQFPCDSNVNIGISVDPSHWTMQPDFGTWGGDFASGGASSSQGGVRSEFYSCDVDVFLEHRALFGSVLPVPSVLDDDDEPVWGTWPSAQDKWVDSFTIRPDPSKLVVHQLELRNFCPLRDVGRNPIQVSVGVRCTRPRFPPLYACSAPFSIVPDAVLAEPPLHCPLFPSALSSTALLNVGDAYTIPSFLIGTQNVTLAHQLADQFGSTVHQSTSIMQGEAINTNEFLRIAPKNVLSTQNHDGNRIIVQEFGWPTMPDGDYTLGFLTSSSGFLDNKVVQVTVLNTPNLLCSPVALAGFLALRSYTTEIDSIISAEGALALPQCQRKESGSLLRLRRVVLIDEARVHLSVYATKELAAFLRGSTETLPLPASSSEAHVLGVTVRGTHTSSDWLTNANALFTECSEIGLACGDSDLHRGFANEYAEIQPTLRALWLRLQSRPTPGQNYVSILVAGHSQGGSIASLLAYDALTFDSASLANDEGTEFFGVTFGAARVGWSSYIDKFMDVVDGAWLSIESEGDAVPETPPLYRSNPYLAEISCDGWNPITCHNIQRYFLVSSAQSDISERSDVRWPAWLRLSRAAPITFDLASLRATTDDGGAESTITTTVVIVISCVIALLCCVGLGAGIMLALVARRSRRSAATLSLTQPPHASTGRQSRGRSRAGTATRSSRHMHHG